MAATLIKICGITAPDALDAAIAARADFAGFVFFVASPRNLALADAAGLAARAGSRVARVGVFVDPDDALLADAIGAGRLDALQLHETTPARRAQIAARFGLPVWAVVSVAAPQDVQAIPEACERVLFDARTPPGASLPGGMGLRFDWNWLAGTRPRLPWGLAGGLSPANVAEAIRVTGAPLVDTSSGVESAPGIKDPSLIAKFCDAARNA